MRVLIPQHRSLEGGPHPAPVPRILLLMAVGLAIRLALIFGLRTYEIPPVHDHFEFAAEYGRIARWIALGHGYASPFSLEHDPPTTLGAPLFPAYLALLFSMFGVYSDRAAAALLVTNAVASTLLIPLLHALGQRLFGATIGWLAAVLVCFHPTLLWFSAIVTWETTLSCLALTLLPALFLWLEDHPTMRRGALAGLVLGVMAHLNMSILAIAAALTAGLVIRWRRRGAVIARALPAMTLVAILVCLPWSIRNTRVAGRPMLLRGGEEIPLHVGNHPGATGYGFLDVLQTDPAGPENALYWQLGEREYLRVCRERALAFIREHPIEYARLVLQRAIYFWIGDYLPPSEDSARNLRAVLTHWLRWTSYVTPTLLAAIGIVVARRRRWRTWPLVVPALVYSVPYMLVFCGGHRHRVPLEGLLILLSSVTLWAAYESLRARRTGGGRIRGG